ncbi:MAG: tRNA (N6-threonylcarbamoyladenosine(37)-N6)-methyltransferase TrmO [Anaerolineae bacterium]|nr:tRNA (N6-threonylcarbamoyladenosine(37)-N6)-methyltransferase TrmO [Anaerolineae bacterium]
MLGLEPGDDIVVLFYFHRSDGRPLQVHPRGDLSRPLRGVFATRSPARPNPIGVTTVRIRRIEGNVIEVVGLDAIDGTPILDIKQYEEHFDTPYEQGKD